MELSAPLPTVEEEGRAAWLFKWPAEDDLTDPFPVQCLVLMRRQGGVLLAFPSAAVSEETLAAAAIPVPSGDAEGGLVGAWNRFSVPAYFGASDPSRQADLVVVDMNVPPADQVLERWDEDAHAPFAIPLTDPEHFYQLNLDALMLQVRTWLRNMATEHGEEGVGFYSAQEGEIEAPPTTPRTSALRTRPAKSGLSPQDGTLPGAKAEGSATPKTAASKKPTVANLATKVDSIMEILPALSNQLQALAEQHEALTKKETAAPQAQASTPGPETPYRLPAASRTAAPVSSFLIQQGSPSTLAKMVGPPPTRVKFMGQDPATAFARTFPEDEPAEIQGTGEEQVPQDQYLQVLLAQSKALTTLVSQLSAHHGDPMTELTGASQGLGVKGTMGREKLQQELAAHSGQFFLSVSLPKHSPKDGSSGQHALNGRGGHRHFSDELPGPLRRFRPGSCSYLQPCLQRESSGSTGPHSLVGRHAGASCTRRRTLASCMATGPTRRSASEPVDQPVPSSNGGEETICSTLFTTMGHNSPSLSQRDRDPLQQENRSNSKAPSCASWTRSKTKAQEKASGLPTATSSRQFPAKRRTELNSANSANKHNGKKGTYDPGHYDTSGGSSRAPSDDVARKFIDSPKDAPDNVKGISFSFSTCCFSIIRWVLASRTAFGRYLASTLCLCRDGPMSSPTALFPLPLPAFKPVESVDPKMPRKAKYHHMVNRPLLVVICALNFIYSARSGFPFDLLRRQPNAIQAKAIDRLRLLVEASDPGGPIEVNTSGRKNLLLVARLQELFNAATALGFSNSPYHDGAQGLPVPLDNSWDPKLRPYTSLNPDRLKVTGEGKWPAEKFISDELWMPFVEPQILEIDHPVTSRGLPNFEHDDPQDVLKLLQKWDTLGLLELHSSRNAHPGVEGKVKIFNAVKNETTDRQIGDRRWRNAYEGRIPGPSSALPTGSAICKILLPLEHGARVCITDRSDFYHQIACSLQRSKTNLIWPPFDLGSFKGTRAYDRFCDRARAPQKKADRTVFGDDLAGLQFVDRDTSDNCQVFGSFRSVLQGDQLGVEFGISSHHGLLKEFDVLDDDTTLRSDRLPRPHGVYHGLVIDDFFSIAAVPKKDLGKPADQSNNRASEAFCKAKDVYALTGLAGSDPKDVKNATQATVVGAHVNWSPGVVKQGSVLVAAPLEKRLAMSWLLLQSSKNPYTTDALHSSLVGGVVSAFCFRRVAMSILEKVFTTIPAGDHSSSDPKLRKLPRSHANELVLAAAILPVGASDLLAQVKPCIYASDASNRRGAFCKTNVPPTVAKALWLSGGFKGKRSFLQPWKHGPSFVKLPSLKTPIGRLGMKSFQTPGRKKSQHCLVNDDP